MRQELTHRNERIRAALLENFSPTLLEIRDESAMHAGHAGARPGGETHYSIKIRAPELGGLTRIARHRAINDALKQEFASGLHALSLDADG